jgi:alpha-galactosidase
MPPTDLAAYAADGVITVEDGRGDQLVRATGEAVLSDGRRLSTLDAASELAWRIEPVGGGVVIRLVLRNLAFASLAVDQLRPLVAPAGFRGLALGEVAIQQTGWQSWSGTHPPAPFEPNLNAAAPPIRGPALPHRQPHSQLEPWVTVLQPTRGGTALLLGFLSARHQLGTLEIIPDGQGHTLVAATELDGVQLPPAAEVVSEPLLLMLGEVAELLDAYAKTAAEHMAARQPAGQDALTGWCSWYQLYTSVAESDVDRNVQILTQHRAELPLRLVQLDDGYQQAVGDWLQVNAKFAGGMPRMVERIRMAGYLPGVWLAPFLLSARSRTFADHPDWVVRDEHAAPLNAIDNWGSANYAVDTTNPAALEWLSRVVRTIGEQWGFEYLKLDFLYAGAMRGRRFDANATGVQAYRRGLETLRQAAGDRFILGCGAPLLSSVGLVDGMRIGADVAAYWGDEGNSDGPSLLNATRATLARLWMHGRWWTNDPDCVVVRAEDTRLSPAEVQAWAAVVALSGGMVLVGDDLSRVPPARLALLGRLLPPSGRAARAYPPLERRMPERLCLRVERPWGHWWVVGIANWTDAGVSRVWTPSDFPEVDPASRYHVVDLWDGEYLGSEVGPVNLGQVPPHGLRLLAAHPDLGRPQTIGSTGHLLGDALDLAVEQWDQASGVLTLVPSGRGPSERRGEFLVYDPTGPIRRVAFASASPTPIHVRF